MTMSQRSGSAVGVAVALFTCALAARLAAATPRTVPSEGYVLTRDGVHIYYEIVGAGPQTIVVSGGMLVRQALAPLATGRRVVFYDARGRGRSDAVPAEQVSLDHQVNDVEDLRIALGLDEMVLLGWSGMGKEMAIYTLRHPDRVERLLQVAPVPPVEGDFMQRMVEKRMSRLDPAAVERLQAEVDAGEWAEDPEGFCRERAEVVRAATFADPANAVASPDLCDWPNEWPANIGPYFDALLPTINAADPREELADLEVPRLVIHGAEDAIPLENVRLWVDGYENACLLVLPGSGHWPFVEAADAFFPAVDAFLAGRWPDGARGEACDGESLADR